MEDDPDTALLLRRLLTSQGHVVLSVREADEGIRVLKATDVRVVLLDWMLPKRSGEAVLRHVRENGLDVPVAVISGVANLKSTQNALTDLGADAVFSKPFSIQELSRWVASQLGRSQ